MSMRLQSYHTNAMADTNLGGGVIDSLIFPFYRKSKNIFVNRFMHFHRFSWLCKRRHRTKRWIYCCTKMREQKENGSKNNLCNKILFCWDPRQHSSTQRNWSSIVSFMTIVHRRLLIGPRRTFHVYIDVRTAKVNAVYCIWLVRKMG